MYDFYGIQVESLFCFVIMSFLPICILLFGSGFIYSRIKHSLEEKAHFIIKIYWIPFLVGIFCFIINLIFGYSFNDMIALVIENAKSINLSDIHSFIPVLFKFDLWIMMIWSIIVGTYFLYRDISRLNHNDEIIRARNKKKEKLEDIKKVPLDYNKNIFIIGKNGSGKTVAISNFVKGHLKKQEFCMIMDGKGDVGQFSLYDIVTRLCKKYGRKIYIINQSLPDETHAYNPFENCNATQIKDMLINMSDWSEEHYRAIASEYFQALAQFMIDTGIKVSFNNLVYYGNNMIFESELEERKEMLNIQDYKYYRDVIGRCGQTVQGSVARFSTLARGIGRKLFRDEHAFNLQTAYDEKAVVLVLLNNLEYTDFARGVGLLVMNDIKNVLGKVTKIKGEHEQFLCVYDELSVYFSTMMIDIVNKSRSLGGVNILSTQTIADMDIIDENARRIVINNMHGFYLLKQADDKSAESLAKAIGTKKATEVTSKIDSFGKTGDGTTKIVDEFFIHPNDLKTLPLQVGYWVDTMAENYKPLRTKFPFVDVSSLEPYKFTE